MPITPLRNYTAHHYNLTQPRFLLSDLDAIV